MQAYYNQSDFINSLNICKAFKRGNTNYSKVDYIYCKQYIKEFMILAWKRARKLKANLKASFKFIREKIKVNISQVIKVLRNKLRIKTRNNNKESILRSEYPNIMKVRIKRTWDKTTGFNKSMPIYYGSKYNFKLQ